MDGALCYEPELDPKHPGLFFSNESFPKPYTFAFASFPFGLCLALPEESNLTKGIFLGGHLADTFAVNILL